MTNIVWFWEVLFKECWTLVGFTEYDDDDDDDCMLLGSLDESWMRAGRHLVFFRIARCILGIVMTFDCLHCLYALLVATSFAILGDVIVKVHEWFLVCYGWLALCLRNNFHLTYVVSCPVKLVSPC